MSLTHEEALKAAYYHEAAHAVCAWLYGIRVDYVCVNEDFLDDSRCACGEAKRWGESAVISLAGDYASARVLGLPDPRVPFAEFAAGVEGRAEEGPSTDGAKVLEALSNLTGTVVGEDLESCYAQACDVAERLVGFWWPEIRRVAERLMEVGYLEGHECVELIEDTLEAARVAILALDGGER